MAQTTLNKAKIPVPPQNRISFFLYQCCWYYQDLKKDWKLTYCISKSTGLSTRHRTRKQCIHHPKGFSSCRVRNDIAGRRTGFIWHKAEHQLSVLFSCLWLRSAKAAWAGKRGMENLRWRTAVWLDSESTLSAPPSPELQTPDHSICSRFPKELPTNSKCLKASLSDKCQKLPCFSHYPNSQRKKVQQIK